MLGLINKETKEFLKFVSPVRLDHETFNVSPVFSGLVFGDDEEFEVVNVEDHPLPEGFVSVSEQTLLVDGIWTVVHELEPIPEKTIEEIRSEMPQLSMVEFRRKLRELEVIKRPVVVEETTEEVTGEAPEEEEGGEEPEPTEAPEPEFYLDGIYEDDILEKINLIQDKKLAAEARDYFMFAQYIERINPWVDILGNMFEITPEQIDGFWLAE